MIKVRTFRSHSNLARLRRIALSLPLAMLTANGVSGAEEILPELETYVVSAAGYEQLIQQAPASISLLTRDGIMESRVNSLAEMLAQVEGVDIGSTAGKTGGLSIGIRGMPSDYTLILIDGRRQNPAGNITPNGFGETGTGFMPPPSAIERVEVIRGPMSTLYGSDAMGGVVNIITRKDVESWSGEVTVGGTLQQDRDFGDSGSVHWYVSGPVAGHALSVGLRGSSFHRVASSLEFRDDSGNAVEVSRRGPSPVQADIHTLGGRLSWNPSGAHALRLDLDGLWQRYDNSEGQLGTLGVQGYADKLEFNRQQESLVHLWRTEDWVLESGITRNVTVTEGRLMPAGTPGKVPGSPRDLENTNLIFDSKLVMLMDKHTLTLGGQFWDAEMVDGVALAPYQFDQWAVFAEDEWRWTPSVGLTLGVRQDQHSDFGSHTSPRAYLVWNPDARWTFKGGVGMGFKAPRLDQIADGITGFTAQGTRPTIGTPGLKPETSTSGEVAVAYDNGGGFTTMLTIFRNAFEDKIANGPGIPNASFAGSPNRPDSVDYGYWPDVDLFAQLVNVDRAVSRGVEWTGQWEIDPKWTVSGSYTYTDSEQKTGSSKGAPLSSTPEHMLNGRLRWKADSKLAFWLSGEYRSERYRTPDTGRSTARQTYGDYRAYSLFHMGCSYELTEHWMIHATISNLLDKNFVKYHPYVSDTASGAIAYTNLYNNNQEPRRLWLSVTCRF